MRQCVAGLILLGVLAGVAAADVPQLLNYQGSLTTPNGAPITGNVSLGFAFWSSDFLGQLLYYEEQGVVEVTKGTFHVLIGSGTGKQGSFAAVWSAPEAYLEVVVAPRGPQQQTLGPRQRIASVVFAMRAGDADTVGGQPASAFAAAGHNHDDAYCRKEQAEMAVEGLQAQVETLRNEVSRLSGLLDGVTRDGRELHLTGMNVHILNGMGATSTKNAVGNLIVGYNEGEDFMAYDRSGSHNVIIGPYHTFSSYGGLVAGDRNSVSGQYSVAFGSANQSRNSYACVTGGYGNVADALYSSVSGGFANEALAENSSVSGGSRNKATGAFSSVSGGESNLAIGGNSCVTGGNENSASGPYSAVSGGNRRGVVGSCDWRAGGLFQDE